MMLRIWLCWIFLISTLGLATGQFPGGLGSGSGAAATPAQQAEVESDSLNIRYFYQDNISLLHYFSDTLLNNQFEQYDPARQQVVDYAQLGNLGTALLPQLYTSQNHLGLDVGFHQYDLYKIKYKEIPFYKVDKAFTDLYFAQGPTQENTYFKAKFTRNFANGINLSVDYKRMNNLGQFKSQAIINTAFGIGIWYHHKGGKYDSFLTYVSNTNDVEDNGGVNIAELVEANTDRVFNIPVFLESAQTFHLSREYAYSQQYNFLGKADSVKSNENRKFVASHDLVFRTNEYKFYDDNPPADTVYYEHLLLDTRGLRYFIEDNSIENNFALSTSSTKQNRRDLLEVSLKHQIHFLNQEPLDSTINHLVLGGRWYFNPNERLDVQTFLSYNLLANFGDYRLGGELFLDFKKAGNFKAGIINHLYSPSLIQQRMFITERELWKNNFDKTLETNLSATYSLPSLGFSVTGRYNLLNNLIYFDTLALPQQTGTPVNILQLIVQQNIKLGKFHLDNTVALQTVSENVIRVPEFFSKHNLYFESGVFRNKVMLLRLGLDLRLVESYFANYYQPLTGQFHLQDSQEVELYPVVDAYTSFKVRHFRFFVRAENLNQLFQDQLYYQAAGYAQPYFTIKFGVSWQLVN